VNEHPKETIAKRKGFPSNLKANQLFGKIEGIKKRTTETEFAAKGQDPRVGAKT